MIGRCSCRSGGTDCPGVSRLHLTWYTAVEALPEPRYHRDP